MFWFDESWHVEEFVKDIVQRIEDMVKVSKDALLVMLIQNLVEFNARVVELNFGIKEKANDQIEKIILSF